MGSFDGWRVETGCSETIAETGRGASGSWRVARIAYSSGSEQYRNVPIDVRTFDFLASEFYRDLFIGDNLVFGFK